MKHFFVIIILFSTNVYSAFEIVDIGARPLGLAGAFTAVSDDVNAIIYNPAGLKQLSSPEFVASYTKLYPGLIDENVGYSGIAYAHNFNKLGVIGLSYTNLGSNLYRENQIILSYGNTLPFITQNLSFGLNFKYLSQEFVKNEYTALDPAFGQKPVADGGTIDLGLLYKLSENFLVGLVGRNLTEPDIHLKSKNKIPLGIQTGVRYNIFQDMVFSTDINYINNSNKDILFNCGYEYWLLKILCLRCGGGVGNNQYSKLSFGIGYKYLLSGIIFQIDYGLEYQITGSNDAHRISLLIKL